MPSLRDWADSFANDDNAPEEPSGIYRRLEEATILERLAMAARPQDLAKIEKRFQRLNIDEIVSYLYFWIYNEYMRSGRFGDVVKDLEATYQGDMAAVMPALSLALNVMHTTGRMATDYAGLSPSELDKLSNIEEQEVAKYAKKIGVPFEAVSSVELYHGSPTSGITKFSLDPKHKRHELPHEGEGIYLTECPEVARRYAGPEGSIYTCKLLGGATFDATNSKDFTRCLQQAKREAGEIRMSPEAAKMIRQTIKRAASGDYGITNFGEQVHLIISNDEKAVSGEDISDKLSKTREVIDAYIAEHPIVKYYDSQIAGGDKLIFVVRDPSLIKILDEAPVQELD
jgi:hypothetical protein